MTVLKKAMVQVMTTNTSCTKTMKKPGVVTKRKVTIDNTATTTKYKSQEALRKETSRAKESPAKKRLRNEKNAHRMRMARLRKKSESIAQDLKRLLTEMEREQVQDRSEKYRHYLVREWFAINRPKMEFNEKIIAKSLRIFMERADIDSVEIDVLKFEAGITHDILQERELREQVQQMHQTQQQQQQQPQMEQEEDHPSRRVSSDGSIRTDSEAESQSSVDDATQEGAFLSNNFADDLNFEELDDVLNFDLDMDMVFPDNYALTASDTFIPDSFTWQVNL